MKTIVIYHSKTGFTKRYAEWIAEATGADCLALSEAKNQNLAEYEAIIYGGWACAGSIRKIKWFKSNIEKWTNKRLIAFCVGASPIENPEIELALKQNFNDLERKRVNVFYCPGGFHYEKLPVLSKLIMKVFLKMMKTKKEKSEMEREMIKMLSTSYDISDKKYIEPILQCLRQ